MLLLQLINIISAHYTWELQLSFVLTGRALLLSVDFGSRLSRLPEWGTLDQNNWFRYPTEISLPKYLGNGMILNPEDKILTLRNSVRVTKLI